MNKKNLPLIIALAIPVLMIILVAAFIYLPGIGKKPQYNFLYMTGDNYYDYYNRPYSVTGGMLAKNAAPSTSSTNPSVIPPKPNNIEARFYLYDVAKSTSVELTFEQTQSYKLDPSRTSPDGYVIERGNYGGDFLFGGGSRDYDSWFIKGHNRSKKLNLKLTGQDYYNFQFLGWIIK